MNITNVKIKRVADSGNMRAVVSVTFDDMFVVHDMKIIEGQNGLFLAMPSKRLHSGEYRDIAHPIQATARSWLEEKVLGCFSNMSEEEEKYSGK